MKDWLDHFRAAACGLPVSHVWRGYGSALFVEFGALTSKSRRDGSPGEPEGKIGLMIEWSWRIEDGRSIACGSWSDEDRWLPTFAGLVGRVVEDIATFGSLPEVMVSLAGDLRVASFMTAEGDPAWTLFDRRNSKPITVGCRDGEIHAELSLELSHLRDFGWRKWDPIGLLATGDAWIQKPFADEYDTYLLRVADDLRRGGELRDVVTYLVSIEREHMGIGVLPGQEARAESPSDNVRPGLSGRDGSDSRRVLKPDLEVPCGPRPLAGSIAAPTCATKPT